MSASTESAHTHDQWRAALARAAAQRDLAELDFYTAVAAIGDTVPQTQMATLLKTTQATVSRWAAKGRERAAEIPAGQPGRDPYEIAQRYALGQIPREQMLRALISWPYEQDFVPEDYWDEIGVDPEGGFERTTTRAFRDGLLSDADYEEILRGLSDAA